MILATINFYPLYSLYSISRPCHLVVVKGTEFFDGKLGRYVDCPVTDVLQMMGRAGRPVSSCFLYYDSSYDDLRNDYESNFELNCPTIKLHEFSFISLEKIIVSPVPMNLWSHRVDHDHYCYQSTQRKTTHHTSLQQFDDATYYNILHFSNLTIITNQNNTQTLYFSNLMTLEWPVLW